MTKLYYQNQPKGLKIFVPEEYIFEVACIKGVFRMVFFEQRKEFKIKPPQDYETWEEFDLDERVKTAITNRAYLGSCNQGIIGWPISSAEAGELTSTIKDLLNNYE